MLTVSQLFIYPVKSLGGFETSKAMLTDRGFEYDRRWMLVDASNRFLSQREVTGMALLTASITSKGLVITDTITGDELLMSFFNQGEAIKAEIWDDTCEVQLVDPAADEWLSAKLKRPCRLVYMAGNSVRKVDTNYAFNNELTSLSDGFPLLIIGQASLDDLNSRLATPIKMDRFRPNIVFTGGEPYQEDYLFEFSINGINMAAVKPCARCPIPTIDQQTATVSKEPLKTLASYRMRNNKVYFGQNLLYSGTGTISVNDPVILTKNTLSS